MGRMRRLDKTTEFGRTNPTGIGPLAFRKTTWWVFEYKQLPRDHANLETRKYHIFNWLCNSVAFLCIEIERVASSIVLKQVENIVSLAQNECSAVLLAVYGGLVS